MTSQPGESCPTSDSLPWPAMVHNMFYKEGQENTLSEEMNRYKQWDIKDVSNQDRKENWGEYFACHRELKYKTQRLVA